MNVISRWTFYPCEVMHGMHFIPHLAKSDGSGDAVLFRPLWQFSEPCSVLHILFLTALETLDVHGVVCLNDQ